ncbi:MAG: hypothetical protein IT487_06985 [Chromatiaceae bacterium]|nr:hypothetical protein [Chromatiaceae bacterium]
MDKAPIVAFVGSYFPAWIPSILLGILCALMAYRLLSRFAFAREIPLPGLFYTLLSGLASMSIWLFLFAHSGA